jgi:RecJ-like exonuclease
MATDTPQDSDDQVPPSAPGAGEAVCRTCSGSGRVEGEECPECGGTGKVIEGIGGG